MDDKYKTENVLSGIKKIKVFPLIADEITMKPKKGGKNKTS